MPLAAPPSSSTPAQPPAALAMRHEQGKDRPPVVRRPRPHRERPLPLPENLFYNTTAPGIVLFLNKAKSKERQGKFFLVNASQVFEKGDPKNFIPDAGIQRIADTLIGWTEEEKLSRIVDHAELVKNDYDISPSRYIHTSDAETYRPIAEIVEELEGIKAEARETDVALRKILKQLGVSA
jgi:type I restriction enzyme M protein